MKIVYKLLISYIELKYLLNNKKFIQLIYIFIHHIHIIRIINLNKIFNFIKIQQNKIKIKVIIFNTIF
jgi:hypothetical protein